jgi:hypothetical protein
MRRLIGDERALIVVAVGEKAEARAHGRADRLVVRAALAWNEAADVRPAEVVGQDRIQELLWLVRAFRALVRPGFEDR